MKKRQKEIEKKKTKKKNDYLKNTDMLILEQISNDTATEDYRKHSPPTYTAIPDKGYTKISQKILLILNISLAYCM